MKTLSPVKSQTMIGFFKKDDGNLAPKEEIESILNKKGIHTDEGIVSHFILVYNQDLLRIKKILPAKYSLVDDDCTELEDIDIENICLNEIKENDDCE